MSNPALRLLELDERHNELLDRLTELDRQVVVVLEEWTRSKEIERAEEKKPNEDHLISAA